MRESKDNFFTSEFLPNPPQFFFKERMGKLNWRNIYDLDVPKLKSNVDITFLDSILDNLVFADVTSEELIRLGENVITKLI